MTMTTQLLEDQRNLSTNKTLCRLTNLRTWLWKQELVLMKIQIIEYYQMSCLLNTSFWITSFDSFCSLSLAEVHHKTRIFTMHKKIYTPSVRTKMFLCIWPDEFVTKHGISVTRFGLWRPSLKMSESQWQDKDQKMSESHWWDQDRD